MNVISATGTYEGVWSGNYDTYMTVDLVNDDGGFYGTFKIIVDDALFAEGDCTAGDNKLSLTEGTINNEDVFGIMEFLPRQDYEGMYAMAASSGYGEDLLEYTIQLKPWGASWEKEISDEFGLVPAEIDAYNQAVAVDERPPYGSTPYNYEELSAEIKSLYAPETEAEPESAEEAIAENVMVEPQKGGTMYQGTRIVWEGDEYLIDELMGPGNAIELCEEDYTGVYTIGGESTEFTYYVSSDVWYNLRLEDETIECQLNGDVLEADFGEGMIAYYEKQ